MGDFAMQMEQLIRKIAVKHVRQFVERRLADHVSDELLAATDSFLQGEFFKGLVASELTRQIDDGRLKIEIQRLANNMLGSLMKEPMLLFVDEILCSESTREHISIAVSNAVSVTLASDQVTTMIETAVTRGLEASLRSVTGRLIAGLTPAAPAGRNESESLS